MCKSDQAAETQSKGCSQLRPAESSGGAQSDADFNVKTFELDVDKGPHQEAIARDGASGVVVLGAFVAGSLVGIVICAPAVVVLICGAGAAAMTSSDSKAGKFFRKVGKVSSDVIFAVFRKGREVNNQYHLTDKAKDATQKAVARVRTGAQKTGFAERIKTGAGDLWARIDERTAPRQPSQPESPEEAASVTDGTHLPFDGEVDAYRASAGNKSVPKSFDT